MNANKTTATNTIQIYFCGGTGINLGKQLLGLHNKQEENAANMSLAFIDTSASNLKDVNQNELVYLIDDVNGSGKERSQNGELIMRASPDVLNRFKPRDFNIVVCSAGGGSGSVFGPAITSELLKQGKSVVVILVGVADTTKEAKNTVKTLQSFENIASVTGKPVPCMYLQNNHNDMTRAKVDEECLLRIKSLRLLLSGVNDELDTADLQNMFNYVKTTGYPSKLISLDLVIGKLSVSNDLKVVAVSTLCEKGGDPSTGITVAYQATGYTDSVKGTYQFVLVDGVFTKVVKSIESVINEYEASSSIKAVARLDVGKSAIENNSGIVF